ncbi:hypothetical protein CK911_01200 [Aeromonas sp. CU5]|uniref:winged helix-turn-helix domain-containing protein n=1 Tax=Aeromonas sp. CU5 TaxID=2033033 RepID=UPI000BFE8AA9|nr:winged helix-turn-helix domain-containing protein [Aeromonas sp. CU5]ATL91565.1 hypothetical protein CK911_01200 [Aeromonas sp. CU5]
MTDGSLQNLVDDCYILADQISFDPILNELTLHEKNIKLAYTEGRTLLLLIHHAGDIVPREKIIDFSWAGRVVTDSSLAKSISNIRKALREFELNEDSIITVPRIGYRLTLRVSVDVNRRDTIANSEDMHSSDTESLNDLTPTEKQPYINKDSLSHKKYQPKGLVSTIYMRPSKKSMQIFSSLITSIMLLLSGYNLLFRIDQDLSQSFISPGYEKIGVKILGKTYEVIKPSSMTVDEDTKSIIKLGATSTITFIQRSHGIYNVSYLLNKNSMSFTFKEQDIERAKCKIKDILSEGERICAM